MAYAKAIPTKIKRKHTIFMKRLVPALATVLTPAVWFGLSAVAAASGAPSITMTASASSAPANGSSAITLTVVETGIQFVQFTDQNGNLVWNCDGWGLTATGSGNTIITNGAVQNTTTNNGSKPVYSGDASGNGTCTSTFQLKSSVAGTKTVGLYGFGLDCPCSLASPTTTVTFPPSAPAAQKTTGSSGTKPTGSTTPTTTTSPAADSTPQPPAAIAESDVSFKIGGQAVDSSKPLVVQSTQPFVLSGKTIPNGIVTLTIHSTPRTATVTADANGNWSYTVTGLEAGEHHAYATVTDPTTKQTSPQTTLASFTVVAAASKAVTPVATKAAATHRAGWVLPVMGVAVLVALGAAGWMFWRKKQSSKNPLA